MASITDYVKEGLKYPFNDGKKVLILGAIFLISSLVSFLMSYFVFDSIRVMEKSAPIETIQAAFSAIPPGNMAWIVVSWIVTFVLLLFAAGYIYNVINYSIENRYELPEFSDIKGIFLNGIRILIVEIAYSILPFILFLLGIMLAVNENVGGSINSLGGIIIVIALIFAIFLSLLEIMAISNMVVHDELSAAFRFNEVMSLIKKIGWGKYIGVLLFSFIVIIVLSIFLGLISGAIAMGISILLGSALALTLTSMIIESLFINSYVTVVIARIYGSLYREVNEE